MFVMVAAGCFVGGAEGGLAGICMALCSLIVVGLGACLQVVIISFSWKYAFSIKISPTVAPISIIGN